ncbi:MAG: hypothetical protein CMN72_09135 [Sphingomonas sp.]|nr:hypothetical protein [Sphingomonas sp.]
MFFDGNDTHGWDHLNRWLLRGKRTDLPTDPVRRVGVPGRPMPASFAGIAFAGKARASGGPPVT